MSTGPDDHLPPGWFNSPLLDVVEINPPNPVRLPADADPVSFVPMAAVTAISGEVDLSEQRRWGQVKKGYTRFQDGDVIFAKITPCMENGKSAVVRSLHGGVGAGSTEFHVLRPTLAVEADLLRYYVLQETFRKAARHNMTGTAGQLRVPVRFIEEQVLPVPPVPEQHRIVASIEDYFSRLDEAVALLERVQRNLKRYRASVLKAAVEGRLVPTEAELARAEERTYEPASVLLERILEERRRRWEQSGRKGKYQEPAAPDTTDLPKLPDGWCWASLDQFLVAIEAGKNFRCEERQPNHGEVGVVKVSAVTWGTFNEEETKTCTRTDFVDPANFIEEGDFLFSRANTIELVGACVRVHAVRGQVMLSDKILRLRFVGGMDSWILWFLRSNWGRRAIESLASGNQESMRNISQANLARIRIPLPPLPECNRIVGAIEHAMTVVGSTERDLAADLARLVRLRQSILKWAFEGRLADQDPADEPASVLLERIRAERAASGAAPKLTRRGRPKRQGTPA